MSEPEIDPELDRARELAERLRAEGHADAAEQVHAVTETGGLGHALLAALREALETVLTTIEALDPKTTLMAEEMRLEIEKRLH